MSTHHVATASPPHDGDVLPLATLHDELQQRQFRPLHVIDAVHRAALNRLLDRLLLVSPVGKQGHKGLLMSGT